jgi:hypothetical protein
MPIPIARRQIDFLAEQWKSNHLDAMTCRDIEDFLHLAIQAFFWICRESDNAQQDILNGARPYSEEEYRGFHKMYAEWLNVCQCYVPHLEECESKGFEVQHAAKFRECLREATGILTPDSDFFSSDSLVILRDNAIDEFRAGGCEDAATPC